MTAIALDPAARLRRLRRFNALLAPLHLVQGILMLALSSAFALPITTSFLSEDPAQLAGPPAPETIVDLRIGPLVAVFLLLSAAAHATLALPRVHRWYEAGLERGINVARWVEYSLSSSVMIVVIALLVGIFDLAALIALFAVNAAMILFGLMMELHNQRTERTSWVAFWLGTIMGTVPWIAIGIYLIGAGVNGDVPGFVYGIYGSIFVFFNVFAINMVLQYRKVGRWRDYLYGERAYMLLSLFAKSALAWQVFGGTLR